MKFFKIGLLLGLSVFIVGCQSNETNEIEYENDEEIVDLHQEAEVDEDIEVHQTDEGHDISAQQNATYLTHHDAMVMQVDLITGNTVAMFEFDEENGSISQVFDFGSGYFGAFAGILNPQQVAIRAGDFNADYVWDHDPEARFLLFNEDLNLLETFFLDDTPYMAQFPFMFDLLTFENNELVVFFMTQNHPTDEKLILQSYNFHTTEMIEVTQTVTFIRDMMKAGSNEIFFIGTLNESDDLMDPGVLKYGMINIAEGVIDENHHDTFQSWKIDIVQNQVLISEENPDFLLDEIHQFYEGVLLFDMITSVSQLMEFEEGSSHFARLSYDGTAVVTLNHELNEFLKYDITTGELLSRISFDDIPEMVSFEQIMTTINPLIIPIDDTTYAIVLLSDMFGFYGVHQLIRLVPSDS